MSRHSQPSNFTFIAILIAAFLMFATNPSKTDFLIFAKSKVVEQFDATDDAATQFVNNLMIATISKSVAESTERNDYIFFSTYVVDLTGLQMLKPDIPSYMKFFGVFGIFIPI